MEHLPDEGIMISKDIRLTSDPHNIIVSVKKTNKKSGQSRWLNTHYFSSIKEAIKFFVDQQIRDTGLSSLKAIDEKIDDLHKIIQNIKIPVQYIEKQTPTKSVIPSSEPLQAVSGRFKRKQVTKGAPHGRRA